MLALISLGFGRGTQVGKTSLLEMEFISQRKRRRWAYSIFHLVRFKPWDPAQVLDLSKKTPHFFTMRSKDSETAHLFDSTVKRLHKLMFEPVSFLLLVCLQRLS